jgi:hypothetical protein
LLKKRSFTLVITHRKGVICSAGYTIWRVPLPFGQIFSQRIQVFGNTMLSRQGASMLGCVGLSDLVAHSEAEYVDAAVRLAGDVARLRNLRGHLRVEALNSAPFDAKTFASDFQNALIEMHREKSRDMRRTAA